MSTEARSYSSGTRGRCITNVRSNHFVVDDADYSGGPHEAITAAEAFLSSITACAVLMVERVARDREIPLSWTDATVEASRDRDTARDGHSVYDRVRMNLTLTGPDEAQAEELIDVYKRR
jgi:uncharacterized OsmC-like protein